MNFLANFNFFGGNSACMMSMPTFSMPTFQMPMFQMPTFQMPTLPMQMFQTPIFQMPIFQMPLFQMPTFNFSYNNSSLSTINNTPTATNVAPYTQNTNVSSNNDHLSGKHDLKWWKSQGYDEEMGKKLAADAVAHAKRDPGQCVGYVRRSLNRVYGSTMKNAGAAYKFGEKLMADPILKNKFKKIDVRGLKDNEFPEGAIVIWRPMTQGYTKGKAALYGHGAVAHNGKGYANGVVNNLSRYAEVWIPVKCA